ncbi:DapH/DapD/GlmU-related protein [Propionicimonas sp.]|uniref:DapH/DapD/GlmU-related protein n=1 Tax=Propionicimonas sp. TaxID=1955623 RepID=UPI0017B0CAF0|nr:DapH/DapD/GlmU-related protein [Propionicimonas sp.]MBU3978046.1 putative colanic acid biosynthesis acetyltransferase [Actinomycetota bacterium]MBA3021968.1 putative colanic acid biosynthesis acetyltransferase [Propionicimonas sp.]MBU3985512.1 putative colanic acid biosynthesis acetyltransferase [Actinomycetota bacterium]MBU4007675.1 putative colanic acid biosynthesis acetyltransferase [Actinomycetota bacterium]MBU4064450.1 putative colanic acid biosynthesis acetyltransferase [Actinomycetot
MAARFDLAGFTGAGYSRGGSAIKQVAWLLTSGLITSHWWCPPSVRAKLLSAFGAALGRNVLIRHRVRIHWPWKLTVGDNSWIGEGTWILNLEPVHIGANTCISQDVFICTGSHDHNSPTFEFDNAPITIGDGAWVAARATVLRGVRIGDNATVGANALVVKDVPDDQVVLAPVARDVRREERG